MLHFRTIVSWFALKVMFMYLFNILLCGLFEVMFKGTSELVEQSDLLTVLQKACGCWCLVCKEQPIRQTTITSINNLNWGMEIFWHTHQRWWHCHCVLAQTWVSSHAYVYGLPNGLHLWIAVEAAPHTYPMLFIT